MGKARIIESLGEGQYVIEIVEARERAELAKKDAEARAQKLQADISALDGRIASAQAAVSRAASAQDAAINQYRQEMTEQGASSVNIDSIALALLNAARQRDNLKAEKRTKALRAAADNALIARINALPPLRQMQAWCADYTDDLTGEVATAEVPGEIGSVIIKPGFENANQWSANEDGAIQPALASTPAGTFYNLAMMPGWQKWRPTFRTAVITGLDGDTCSISLDAATSSQHGLSVNAQSSYSGVPILYMECDGGAFEVGDKVLVALVGNVDRPTVVGFEREPRVCNLGYAIISMHTDIDDFLGGYPERSELDGDFNTFLDRMVTRDDGYTRITMTSRLTQFRWVGTDPGPVYSRAVSNQSPYPMKYSGEIDVPVVKDENEIISRNVFKCEVSVPLSTLSVTDNFSGAILIRGNNSSGSVSGTAVATLRPSSYVKSISEISVGGVDLHIERHSGFTGNFQLRNEKGFGPVSTDINFDMHNLGISLTEMGYDTYPFKHTFDDLSIANLKVDLQKTLLYLDESHYNYHVPGATFATFNQERPYHYRCTIFIIKNKRKKIRLLVGVRFKTLIRLIPLLGIEITINGGGEMTAERFEITTEDHRLYMSETGIDATRVKPIPAWVGQPELSV